MIKLFRNTCKNLLAEGKTTRYLKYAIGEIILVVIGILQRKIIHYKCPVRDIILVEIKEEINQRAVRYEI